MTSIWQSVVNLQFKRYEKQASTTDQFWTPKVLQVLISSCTALKHWGIEKFENKKPILNQMKTPAYFIFGEKPVKGFTINTFRKNGIILPGRFISKWFHWNHEGWWHYIVYLYVLLAQNKIQFNATQRSIVFAFHPMFFGFHVNQTCVRERVLWMRAKIVQSEETFESRARHLQPLRSQHEMYSHIADAKKITLFAQKHTHTYSVLEKRCEGNRNPAQRIAIN